MKVLVIDSTGLSDVTPKYRSYFGPNIKLIGHEPSKYYGQVASGEHGYQCGYYAGVLLNLLEGEHEIHFARIFDQNSEWIEGSEDFILDTVQSANADVINCSWGMDDGDTRRGEEYGQRAWSDWAIKFRQIISEKKAAVFFASGNDDKNDVDDDVSFPQRLLPGQVNIVGSHTRSGKPSVFSGDGVGVQLTMWGEDVALLSKEGRWERGSGTSFSSPKAAGLCAYLGLDYFHWRKYVLAHATRPDNFSGFLPHPKWGQGSLEYRYQELLSELPRNLRPPSVRRRKLAYVDRRKII